MQFASPIAPQMCSFSAHDMSSVHTQENTVYQRSDLLHRADNSQDNYKPAWATGWKWLFWMCVRKMQSHIGRARARRMWERAIGAQIQAVHER